jgi:hypothetical protein
VVPRVTRRLILLVLPLLFGCSAETTKDTATPPSHSPTASVTPASSVDEIDDLEGYTCLAFNSGEDALESGDLEAAFVAAQRMEVAAGQWEETVPALGQSIRDLARGLRGGLTDAKALAELRRLRDGSFPSCVSAGPLEEPVEEPTTFGDGTWVVGEDIGPGLYRNEDPSSGCYWERMRNFAGGMNSILANGLDTRGPIVVEILGGDKGFTSQDCGEWTSNLSRVSTDRTQITDGIWIVGVDVQPGTYRSSNPGSNCYWERMHDFSQGLNSIIANGIPGGASAIVEIRASDAGFTSTGCGTWAKV